MPTTAGRPTQTVKVYETFGAFLPPFFLFFFVAM
jgi:hypothetical protein